MAGQPAVQITSDDLVDVARACRQASDGRALRKQLRKDITAEGKPVVAAIRRKVKTLPSKGESKRRGRPGLRNRTARATRLQAQMSGRYAGVTIRVDPKKMPPGMHNLPAYLEGRAPFDRWRSPNFGRTADEWKQQPPHPYFYAIAERAEPAVKRAVAEGIDSIRRQIEA